MSKPFVVCFAGVPGCGKSSVAEYLGEVFGLPRFERDKIRDEVRVDMSEGDITKPEVLKEFNFRADSRLESMLKSRREFIMDSSVDRRWGEFKQQLDKAGYEWLLISFDMSYEWVKASYERFENPSKGLEEHYCGQHEAFVNEHGIDVDVVIDDENHPERNLLCEKALRDFLKTI